MSSSDSQPPAYMGIALGISSQDWYEVGLGDDPAVAASSDLEKTVERITALLLIRIVAWIQPRGTFTDLSTTTICRRVIVAPESWPTSITSQVLDQLKQYVKVILTGYQEVPYHNFEHCYHVTVSTNKLLDIILHNSAGSERAITYGYRDDPLMQLVQIFAALIHDVEHMGIPNRQLALEDGELALRYNDQSIAEMRSLTVGFTELLKPDYLALRTIIFPQSHDYRRFRSATINLVLTTDLASPERAQIGKSKWKEAFGDPYETVERKVLKQMERRASMASPALRKASMSMASRRMSAQSIMSEMTMEYSAMMVDEQELDDDDSVSSTPDNSDNEDGQMDERVSLKSGGGSGPVFRPPQNTRSEDGLQKYYSSPHMRSKLHRKSGNNTLSPEGGYGNSGASNVSGMALKFHRRLSSIGPGNNAPSSKRYHNTRLGLLRTVDLSGESIETYQELQARPSATGASTEAVSVKALPAEDIDQLRESVVMETIMKAADVAHNLQGWNQMAKWSNRLFLELKRAYVQGRGDDPQGGWFTNQIGFLEAYLLPLARKLDDTGVFGDTRGALFAEIVLENKERWMREGMALTADIIRQGHAEYPEAETDDEG